MVQVIDKFVISFRYKTFYYGIVTEYWVDKRIPLEPRAHEFAYIPRVRYVSIL